MISQQTYPIFFLMKIMTLDQQKKKKNFIARAKRM